MVKIHLIALSLLAACWDPGPIRRAVDHDPGTDRAWIEAWGADGSRWCVSVTDMNLDCAWLDAHGGHLP